MRLHENATATVLCRQTSIATRLDLIADDDTENTIDEFQPEIRYRLSRPRSRRETVLRGLESQNLVIEF